MAFCQSEKLLPERNLAIALLRRLAEGAIKSRSAGYLCKYKHPPDLQEAGVDLVQQQVQAMGQAWTAAA